MPQPINYDGSNALGPGGVVVVCQNGSFQIVGHNGVHWLVKMKNCSLIPPGMMGQNSDHQKHMVDEIWAERTEDGMQIYENVEVEIPTSIAKVLFPKKKTDG